MMRVPCADAVLESRLGDHSDEIVEVIDGGNAGHGAHGLVVSKSQVENTWAGAAGQLVNRVLRLDSSLFSFHQSTLECFESDPCAVESSKSR